MEQPITLSTEQREALTQALSHFKKYAATEEYRDWLREGERQRAFFCEVLPSRLEQLSEADIGEMVSSMWAWSMWANKGWVAEYLIRENTLPRLAEGLKLLYDTRRTPEENFEAFLRAVKGMGTACVTEILAYLHPGRCGIWNQQARKALQLLKATDNFPLKQSRLSKEEYARFNRLVQLHAEEIRRSGIINADSVVVAIFHYYLATQEPITAPEPEVDAKDFDHDEIRDLIARIGANLGFDTSTEVAIGSGARVDVVWRARIGNLGMVQYVFEVHRSGSADSLILNLQKALNSPYVQKVVAVSDSQQLERIKRECEELPEQFRRALRLWNVDEVVRVANALDEAIGSISRLGLTAETR